MVSKIKNGETIVFTGDSITDCGRLGAYAPLGNGYVKIFYNLFLARYPEINVRIFNTGISGNTIYDLSDRWLDDVLSLNPDWISVLIGINDLHRMLAGELKYDPKNYYEAFRRILDETSKRVKGIILMSPFYISRGTIFETHRKKVLEVIPQYISYVERLSNEFSTYYIDLHSVFQDLIKVREPIAYAPEPVHPNETGHTVIALKLLELLTS